MLNKLIYTRNANVKNSHTCENGSIQKGKNKTYTQSKNKSNVHFSFNWRPTLNYSIIIFTIFSIILPIGTQPILQTNLAFAQSDLSSQSSDSKLQIDSKDPFDFSGKNIKKASENIIIPDIVGPDHESDRSSSSTISPPPSQSQSQSSAQPNYQSHPDNNIDKNNSHNDESIETDDKPGTGLSSTISQTDIPNSNNINNNTTNEETIEEVIELEDQSSSTQSDSTTNAQSQSSAQPNYQSHPDNNIDKNNSHNDESIETDDKPGTGLSSTISQTDIPNSNNINNNTTNEETIEEVIELEDQSSSTQSDSTTNAQSQSQSPSSAQPKYYKSYRDYMEKNNQSANADINVTDDTQGVESSSSDSQINTGNGNININKNTNDIDIIVPQDKSSNEDISSTELSSSSSASSEVSAQSSREIYGDFNGDGRDDLAIGVPQESVGPINLAGAVNVIYGSSNGLSATSPRPDQFWTQDSADVEGAAEFNDRFGNSLSPGDYNGDGFDDLAIGAHFEDVTRAGGTTIDTAGAVNILYGSSNGLSATASLPDQIWTQDSPDVNDFPEFNDRFGNSLSSGDFNGDGRDDLAIGLPDEDVAGSQDEGAVHILYGSATGLSATSPRSDQFWTQDSPDVEGAAEEFDAFGKSLSSGDFNGDGRDDLAIGIPDEDVVRAGGTEVLNAGGVNILYGSSNGLSATSPIPDQIWTQDSPDVNDFPEPGDRLGLSLSSGDFNDDGRGDLAIGVSSEDVDTGTGTIDDAGAVNILYGSSNGLSTVSPIPDQFWTQDSPEVNDLTESADFFGGSLSSGDFNGDGRDDLAIGISEEDVVTGAGTQNNAGAVNILYGSSNGLSAISPRPDQFWTQSTTDVNDIAELNDQFGRPLSSGDYNGDGRDDLAIGVLLEDVLRAGGTTVNAAGAVNILYGNSNGLSATSPIPDQFWTQDSPDVNDFPESADVLGSGLA